MVINNINTQLTDKIEEAYKLLTLFDSNNYEAYIVGGASRNCLRGLPSIYINDIDITTSATPEQIIALANTNNINWFREGRNGENYGTVTLLYNNIPMQITPFRSDKNYDGRHCDCEFVKTLKEDLKRRDFTINAIALDKDGYPIDYFCGIADLTRRRVKSIEDPEITYQRDELRAMRAIRLATTTGFEIEESTYSALKNVKLSKLSKERIHDELIEILESPNRYRGIILLDETGLLAQIVPEIEALKGINQDERFHPEKDVFVHIMLAVKNLPINSSLELVLATLFHDIAKPIVVKASHDGLIHFYEHELYGSVLTEEILYRLKFKVTTIKKVKWLIENHMRIHHFSEMRKSKKIQLITNEYFNDLIELLRADILGSSGLNKRIEDLSEIRNIIEFTYEYKEELEERPVLKEKLVNGYDVINVGVSPKQGILIGQILEKINDEIIDGTINNREEALKRIGELIIVNNRYGTLDIKE